MRSSHPALAADTWGCSLVEYLCYRMVPDVSLIQFIAFFPCSRMHHHGQIDPFETFFSLIGGRCLHASWFTVSLKCVELAILVVSRKPSRCAGRRDVTWHFT